MEEFEGLKIPPGFDELYREIEDHKGCILNCPKSGTYLKAGCGGDKILCSECICHPDNREIFNKWFKIRLKKAWDIHKEMLWAKAGWHKSYRGLTVPPGLCKSNADEIDLNQPNCTAYPNIHTECKGIQCDGCICCGTHKKQMEELLKMWKEGDNPIKPGMVVQTKDNDYCLVERVSEECVRGWSVWHNVTDRGRSLCELRDYRCFMNESIRAVYKLKNDRIINAECMPNGDSIRRLTSRSEQWERLWEKVDPPVLELTVKDIEEKYGRKVKIVGEQNA